MEWDVAWASPLLAPALDSALDLRHEMTLKADWHPDLELFEGMLRESHISQWPMSAQFPPGYDDQVAREGYWSSRHVEEADSQHQPLWVETALARGLLIAEQVENQAAQLGVGSLAHVFTLSLPMSDDDGWESGGSVTYRFHTMIDGLWYWDWESGNLTPEEAFGVMGATTGGGARVMRRR